MIITEPLLEEFEQHTQEVVKFDMVEEARIFINQVWPEISADQSWIRANSEVFARLRKVQIINTILLLDTLSDKKILELCEDGLGLYFTEMIENIDLWPLLRGKLVTIYDFNERDILKEKIRKALVRNKDIITKKNIVRNDKTFSPSLGEWLVDYTSDVGVGSVDQVRMNEYLVSNKNCRQLDTKEKEIIRQLVTIYERLKKLSNSAEGLEERVMVAEDGRFAIFRDGSFENIDPRLQTFLKEAGFELETASASQRPATEKDVSVIQTLSDVAKPRIMSDVEQAIFNAYRGGEQQYRAIIKELDDIKKKIGSDTFKIRSEFYTAVQKKNVVRAIALLRVMAEAGDIPKFMEEDERLQKFLSAVWEKRYGSEFVAQFRQNPDQVQFVKQFLRYILEERLGMTENDAARIGLQIGNIFVNLGKKSYNKMAYFDVPSKLFHWFD